MRPIMKQTATALLCAVLVPSFAAGANAGGRHGGGAPSYHSGGAWHPTSAWHGSGGHGSGGHGYAWHPAGSSGWVRRPVYAQTHFAGLHRYHQYGAARALEYGARRTFGYETRGGYGYGSGYSYGTGYGYGYGDAGSGADYGASEYATGYNAPLPGQPLYNQPGAAAAYPSFSRSYVVPTTVYQPVTRTYTVPVMTYQTYQRTEQVPVTVYRRYVKTCSCSYSPE